MQSFLATIKIENMSEPAPRSIREYMSAIGSKKTTAKVKASRENASKAAAARRRNALDLLCNCGGESALEASAHKTTCPRGRLLYQRERTAKLREDKLEMVK